MSIRSMIEAEAIIQGVPISIALAVAEQESQFNQNAVGSSGEIGVFQLMPGTAAGLGVNPYDLSENINGGIRYLAEQFNKFGNWDEALAAYNAGPGNVTRNTIPASTRNYVSQVFNLMENYLTQTTSVDMTPTFSVDVFDTVSTNFLLLAAIGLGIGSVLFMTVKDR